MVDINIGNTKKTCPLPILILFGLELPSPSQGQGGRLEALFFSKEKGLKGLCHEMNNFLKVVKIKSVLATRD
jgi:hypothetical protein